MSTVGKRGSSRSLYLSRLKCLSSSMFNDDPYINLKDTWLNKIFHCQNLKSFLSVEYEGPFYIFGCTAKIDISVTKVRLLRQCIMCHLDTIWRESRHWFWFWAVSTHRDNVLSCLLESRVMSCLDTAGSELSVQVLPKTN